MGKNEDKKAAEGMVEQIKEAVKKGNIARVLVKKNDHTYVNIPLNVGVVGGIVGLAAAPWAMLLAAIATIGADCQVELYTTDGEILDISGKAIGKAVADKVTDSIEK